MKPGAKMIYVSLVNDRHPAVLRHIRADGSCDIGVHAGVKDLVELTRIPLREIDNIVPGTCSAWED